MSRTTEQRLAAIQSVMAMPYRVHAYESWADLYGTTVGFQTEDEARRFASLRPEPLIDLVQRNTVIRGRETENPRVIASRRLVPHPLMSEDRVFVPVDDFPDARP